MGFHDSNGNYHEFRATLPLSLYDFREVDASGDVGDTTAIGGVLASDTTPILRGDTNETQELSWAASNSDPIACQIALPLDFSGKDDVHVELFGYGGSTNAFSVTVESGWDGEALVSDVAAGSASATPHKATAVISAADIPDSPSYLTLILTPGAHTTDAMGLLAARVTFVRKALDQS